MALILEMYPNSFNQLRKMLHDNFPDLFLRVGWAMANDHLLFIRLMNAATDTLCLPELGIDECCQRWLAALDKKRGSQNIILH